MSLAVISITNNCNFRCKTCDIGQKNLESSGLISNWCKDDEILTPEQWEAGLDKINATKIDIVGIEPLLYPDFGKLLKVLKKKIE